MGWGGGVRRGGWSGEMPAEGEFVKKSRQAVGAVPGSCQLSALTAQEAVTQPVLQDRRRLRSACTGPRARG